MGIRGSVKRGIDGHFIHANCDTDIIVGEEPPLGNTSKPEELYQIIERFCNGKRSVQPEEALSLSLSPAAEIGPPFFRHPLVLLFAISPA